MPFIIANIKTLGFSDFDLVLNSTVKGKYITVYELKLNQHSTYANEVLTLCHYFIIIRLLRNVTISESVGDYTVSYTPTNGVTLESIGIN